ncbi:hypothetical protein GMLC_18650 [Geomonas limicola]|uniref:Lipoprotein n=1 Tax=Geomonas limicola TaxID=2740186 RepID=A0A6V8N6T7_9BACT|nr:hypothetical protein [Geomonas limicola]GFO68286.1 hypothetical protein GMLC_18650 [Geomonas limicola]
MNKKFASAILAALIWVAAAASAAHCATEGGKTAAEPAAKGTAARSSSRSEALALELKTLKDALPAKQAELAKLRHRWLVAKGRTPTAAEIKEYEKKRAKGKVTVEDNPYVTKTPLSNPAPYRAAYYKKLEEVTRDEEEIARLEQQLAALKLVPAN